MSETHITLHGWVGNDVTHRDANGTPVVHFRVASTPRIKRKGEWQDGETTWYSVSAWRSLADNVVNSVHKGDAVIVHGRLRTESWTREDGQVSQTLAVDATLVGHDLRRGTSAFTRTSRPERADSEAEDEAAEMIHSGGADSPPFDSWGEPREPEAAAADSREPAA
jgi:single-strand DNA-binding protein